MKKDNGPNVNTPEYQVSGIARIIDKDGNIKGEMEIVSLELNEELGNAIKHDSQKHTS
jgi:hypothetical protein